MPWVDTFGERETIASLKEKMRRKQVSELHIYLQILVCYAIVYGYLVSYQLNLFVLIRFFNFAEQSAGDLALPLPILTGSLLVLLAGAQIVRPNICLVKN